VDIGLHSFLSSALDTDEWSVSNLGIFTAGEWSPCIHWTEDSVGPTTGLYVSEQKRFAPVGNLRCKAYHESDYAAPAPLRAARFWYCRRRNLFLPAITLTAAETRAAKLQYNVLGWVTKGAKPAGRWQWALLYVKKWIYIGKWHVVVLWNTRFLNSSKCSRTASRLYKLYEY
jgi:hypothetical protein